jgi:hypothetical protein
MATTGYGPLGMVRLIQHETVPATNAYAYCKGSIRHCPQTAYQQVAGWPTFNVLLIPES